MKCPKCNGSGWDDEHMIKCLKCDNGVIEQTNEEWFCGLSTEEKARVLDVIHWEIQNYRDDHPSIEDDDVSGFYLKWLKEKHEE